MAEFLRQDGYILFSLAAAYFWLPHCVPTICRSRVQNNISSEFPP